MRQPELMLTLDEARKIAVAAQGLDRRPRGRVTKDRIRDLFDRLGCIQLDTISVISRSHETVVWSRLGRYDPALLAELHHPDGYLMEYWAHAAALVPVSFFPLFQRTMEQYREQHLWARENQQLLSQVLKRIERHGPLRSADFARPEGPRPEAWDWWGGKPDRRALDALWTTGDLMILKRDGFQRTYELTERLLPAPLRCPPPTLPEQEDAFVRAALSALGIATPRWTADYFRTGGRSHVPAKAAMAALERLTDDGRAVPIVIEGLPDPAWLASDQLPLLDALRAGRQQPVLTTFLSPFDNLIWHRPRTAELFGFEYRIECYTPAPKRRYGYYSLPILHRGRLIGRLDPSLNRRTGLLTIKSLHIEPGIRLSEGISRAVASALRNLASFLGASEITILESDPRQAAAAIQGQL